MEADDLRGRARRALQEAYHSPLVERIKAQGYLFQEGRLSILLAEEFGFCYGVDRAIDYAYQTRARFPGRRILITDEIIHNPQVNNHLREMGVCFLSGAYGTNVSVDSLGPEDVVIIPAFGTTTSEFQRLRERGCVLVDTTCGSVMSVWKRVESYSRDGFTSVIHGKYDHEETKATCSRAIQYPGGKYLVVRDQEQTRKLCDYILGRISREVFLKEFSKSMSPGFEPDRDLGYLGCANQTTMLSGESVEIARLLEAAMRERYGEEELAKRFRHYDTICSATQDRQDAVTKLIGKGIGLMIVIGGFNSSNTGHLAEIASKSCPTYHIDDASCILTRSRIRHKKPFCADILETDDWLPEGHVRIGITAGASTPNRMIEEVIRRLFEIGL